MDVDRLLRERHGVAVEGSDLRHVYLVVSPADHDAAVDRLAAGLEDLRRQRPDGADPVLTPLAATTVLTPRERVVSPRVAWFAPSEPVALHAAAGRVAAEPATPYPAGVPVLVPGEVIDEAQIELLESVLAAGGHVHGTADPSLTTLRVMAAR